MVPCPSSQNRAVLEQGERLFQILADVPACQGTIIFS
jgi:hypothetical protein